MKKKLISMLLVCSVILGGISAFAEPVPGEGPDDLAVTAEAPAEAAPAAEETAPAAEEPAPAAEAPAYDAVPEDDAPAAAYQALRFEDVPEWAWYYEAVNYITSSGYMNGVSDTQFAPDSGMTRAMFVTALGRMDGAYVGDYNKKIFEDVESDLWYSQYVNWAFTNNIVTGFDDLKFHPNDEINRAQLAVMIKRYADFAGFSFADNPNAFDEYTDMASIPEWSRDGVDLMRRTGIITGDSYGNFMPYGAATRAQIAAIIMRMRRVMNGEVLDIPQRQVESRVSVIMKDMSLRDKIYQMIAMTPDKITRVSRATLASSATADALSKQPVGMIVYTGNNIIDEAQIKDMVAKSKSYCAITPFMAISEEVGSGATLASRLGRSTFTDAYDYRNSSSEDITAAYSSLGATLAACGFNTDLAPTADLWTEPSNTYIGKRSFGNSYEECTRGTLAAISGLKQNGLLTAMKYFPGYGSSNQNPIDKKCESARTIEDLRNYDFNTYKNDIDAGVDFVLVSNIIMTNIDAANPASMSQYLINDVLKNELGFSGIVMTDDFGVKAIAGYYSSAEAAKRAVIAGCDMILCPDDAGEAVNALMSAVQNGEISENRINESVEKILSKKLDNGIIQ